MRKHTTLTAIAVLMASSAGAMAADLSLKDTPYVAAGGKLEWTANFGATSDYIFRGFSQNGREPAVQGGLDVSYGMFYAGTWVSMVNFDPPGVTAIEAGTEVDVYAGFKPKWGDITFDFGVIGYLYPGVNVDHAQNLFEQNYVEFKAGASKTVFNDITWSSTIFVSPDYIGETGTTITFEDTVSKPLYKYHAIEFTGSASLGYTDFLDKDKIPGIPSPGSLDSYYYYNVGVTAAFSKFSLDFRWWDTSLNDTRVQCGENKINQCGSAFAVTGKITY
jgi:uncharacterized protein (TIGR02001 family)